MADEQNKAFENDIEVHDEALKDVTGGMSPIVIEKSLEVQDKVYKDEAERERKQAAENKDVGGWEGGRGWSSSW